MKTLKLIIIALLLGATGLSKAYSYDFSSVCSTGDTLYYRIISNSSDPEVALVRPSFLWIGYTQPSGEILIPDLVANPNDGITYFVTKIDDDAFESCYGITSIEIPISVTSIGRRAFDYCNINSITIPASVTSIGRWAFTHCGNLTEILVSSANVRFSSDGIALYSYDMDTLIQYPQGKAGDFIVPNTVTTIGYSAFESCHVLSSITLSTSLTSIESRAFWRCSGLNAITFPNTLETIETDAFLGCTGLTSIELPATFESIGVEVFSECHNLMSINVDPNNTHFKSENGVLFNSSMDILLQFPGGKAGVYIIPNTVTTIGTYAFYDCTKITYVNIPNSVTTIEDDAFCMVTALTSITIPSSVTSIGDFAFHGCTNLNSVFAKGTNPPLLGTSAFYRSWSDDKVPQLFVPCYCKDIYEATSWQYYFDSIEEDCGGTYSIHNGTTSINCLGGSFVDLPTSAQSGDTVCFSIALETGSKVQSIVVHKADDATQIIPFVLEDNTGHHYCFVMPSFGVLVQVVFVANTGVDEKDIIPVSIYPNPVKDKVTIETENIKHISISNMMGQLIYEGAAEGDNFEYDFSGKEAGVYLVRIETSNGTVSKRIVVTK